MESVHNPVLTGGQQVVPEVFPSAARAGPGELALAQESRHTVIKPDS
jgi:hypothetical protein